MQRFKLPLLRRAPSPMGEFIAEVIAYLRQVVPFTGTTAGLVPDSSGGTSTFLRADGTWATPAGGGGGGALFTSTTQGEVPASGGGATNYLRADGTWTAPPGSSGVPTTRLVSTSAPLSGGGDLSADRTLSISTFSSGASGIVPASGGGTVNFLRADGAWSTGVSGPTGATGPSGPPGFNGDDGDDGWVGPPGPAGIQGIQGLRGQPGEDGADGEDGARGPQGIQGIQGVAGAQGPLGFAIDGEDGADGFMGLPGPQGNPGPTGAQGQVGPSTFFVMDDMTSDDALWVPPDARIDPPSVGGLQSVSSDQAIAAATSTLITGTLFQPSAVWVGQTYRWTIVGSGGAAGTAANTIVIRGGTTGTVSDGIIASFTTTVGTAAASDFVIEVYMTVRTVGTSGTCAVKCVVRNSAAAGFINATVNVLAATPVVYNNLNAGTKHHISLLTGASKTATITQAYVEVLPGR